MNIIFFSIFFLRLRIFSAINVVFMRNLDNCPNYALRESGNGENHRFDSEDGVPNDDLT